jgi:aldehyde dehydrogenase (NAD+)
VRSIAGMTTREEAIRSLPGTTMLIGGEPVSTSTGGTMTRIDPTTGDVLAEFPVAGPKEVDAAVTAAHKAFPAWRALTADKRRELLWRVGELLRSETQDLPGIAALETGHPAHHGLRDMATDHFQYYAGFCDKLNGEVVPSYPAPAFDYTKWTPYGVIGALVTWNGPFINSAIKTAPALAAGNCIVLKSPDLGPFAPMRFVEICHQAGIPDGVVNVISGGAATGEALIRHELVRKVTFTGGPQTARKVVASAAESLTPLMLELGGKSASIMFEDAEIGDATRRLAIMATIGSTGQGCLFPTRLLAHVSIYDEVVERARAIAESPVIGDPFDPKVTMGPVINEAAVERILGYVEEAKRSARLVTGGERLGGDLAKGCFVTPTVFAEVDNQSRLAQEEVFGPVLAIMPFTTEEEAIALANDSKYGLAAYIDTNDLARAHRVADKLDAGYIGINGFPSMTATAPFGGTKISGFGREGGRVGIEEYAYLKNVYIPLG